MRSLHCLRLMIVAVSTWWQAAISDPQINLLAPGCSSENAENGAAFQSNLESTFSALRTQLSEGKKFFATANYTTETPQPVYSMAQCRNYMSKADCLTCFDAAVSQIQESCSIKTTNVIGARLLFEGCFLRYEAYNFYDKTIDSDLSCNNQSVAVMEFGATRDGLVRDLVRAAPKRHFSANKRVVPNTQNLTVYGIAQCVESVTQHNCKICLKGALQTLRQCLFASHGAVWDAACFIRYSNISFFSDDQNTSICEKS